LPVSHFSTWTNLSLEYSFDVPHRIVSGGNTRFQSVKNGINAIEVDCLVAVHDGVRPVISSELIGSAFAEASLKGNAVASVPLKESIRRLKAKDNQAVDRSDFRLMQTPQVFQIQQLKTAYEIEFEDSFTDDASVAEKAGFKINLIDGDPDNTKITSLEDLVIAEALLKITDIS